jgi:hypothetical protein
VVLDAWPRLPKQTRARLLRWLAESVC